MGRFMTEASHVSNPALRKASSLPDAPLTTAGSSAPVTLATSSNVGGGVFPPRLRTPPVRSFVVDARESTSDRLEGGIRAFRIDRLLRCHVVDGPHVDSGDVFHHQKMEPICLVSVVGGDDVRVTEPCRRLHLALESRDCSGLTDQFRRQELDRHQRTHPTTEASAEQP